MATANRVTISRAVFRDLISQKSKIEDIKVLLAFGEIRSTRRFREKLTEIVYSKRYSEGGETDAEPNNQREHLHE